MNFFQQQDVARRKTMLLVFLLTLAVLSLIAVTVLLLGVFFYFLETHATSISAANAYNTPLPQHLLYFVQSKMAAWVALGVVLVVTMGMLYKYLQLNGGGRKVAEALGGRLLNYDGATANERKLLNIVEEMAIASGNPVPPVYVLDEDGINAFAAGLSRRDCVIGVTRGCANLLNRDELQGVIAHEFSHIHNGDMRLNMRLIAILHGILLVGLIGYFFLRSSAGYRVSSRSKNNGAQIGLAMGLIAIGYAGTFFGNLIKAAVSRQREFLADASAVQYTRNPEGIGNALKKIGGYSSGSILTNGTASQFSHMYFGEGVKASLSSLFATHPPLHERIRRIEPNWSGSYIQPEERPTSSVRAHHSKQHASVSQFSEPVAATSSASAMSAEHFERQAVSSVGEPQASHLEQAKHIIDTLPNNLCDAAHEPFSARALIYCMLLDNDNRIRDGQVQQLRDAAHPATFKVMQELYPYVFQLPREEYIALIEMSIPALKQLSGSQYAVFKKNLVALIQADRKISLFEWCVFRIVTNNAEAKVPESKYKLAQLPEEISILFSLIIHAGKSQSPGGAFQKGIESLGLGKTKFTLNTSDFSFHKIDQAIEKLAGLKVLQKPRLLKAVAEIIAADGKVTPTEAELYRAIADSLDCPVPPIR